MQILQALTSLGIQADFGYAHRNGAATLIDIHRKIGDADVYFVSNQRYRPAEAICSFRVQGKMPELWHADTGKIETAPAYNVSSRGVSLDLKFSPAESVFVVFRKRAPRSHLIAFSSNAPYAGVRLPAIEIQKAWYGSADGRGVDVTAKVRQLVMQGETEIAASNSL
jgi:hypothetical protein